MAGGTRSPPGRPPTTAVAGNPLNERSETRAVRLALTPLSHRDARGRPDVLASDSALPHR